MQEMVVATAAERDRLKAALEGQTWQPIETAPEDGTRVLLIHPLWQAASTGQFYGARQGWKLDNTLPPFTMQPTHWKHLPVLRP